MDLGLVKLRNFPTLKPRSALSPLEGIRQVNLTAIVSK